MRPVIAALAVSLIATGCGGNSAGPAPQPGQPVDLTAVRLSAAEVDRLAAADGRFAGALYNALAHDDGNLVLSPTSVAIALQMAYAGARGETAQEMASMLDVPNLSPRHVAAAAAHFLTSLSELADEPHERLSIANTVWVQSGFPLTTSYETAMRSGFGAGMRRLDLDGDPEGSRATINESIATATHDKIRDLLPPGSITPLMRLVLTNAVYLHADWATPFEPDLTLPRVFHHADGSTTMADSMTQEAQLGYERGDGYQAVQLPYAGGRLAMTILLPDGDLAPLEQRLAEDGPAALSTNLAKKDVALQLPLFRFTWASELTPALVSLGMRTAFTDAADFSGISTADELEIARVQHKAFISVDEHGTEAAAATAITMTTGATLVPVPRGTVVAVNHPFLFTITDTTTGLPLFIGRVTDPS